LWEHVVSSFYVLIDINSFMHSSTPPPPAAVFLFWRSRLGSVTHMAT
jgi:hypothetical protein